MNQREVIREWVRRLRSGDYLQGRSVLEKIREDGRSEFCCLGVLCRIAVEEGLISSKVLKVSPFNAVPIVEYGVTETLEGNSKLPTVGVQEWSGVNYLKCCKYAHMNDSEHKTFNEIANEVERDFSPYFTEEA